MQNELPAKPWRGKRSDGKRLRGVSAELRQRAYQLRAEMTPSEKILWEALRLRQLDGARFRRQHALETFILDFYCPEHRLILEVDGEIHRDLTVAAHDVERQHYLEQQGYRVIRFTNKEVQEELPSVLQRIRQAMERDAP